MARKGYAPEQIINKLRETELLLQQGVTISVISKTRRMVIYNHLTGS